MRFDVFQIISNVRNVLPFLELEFERCNTEYTTTLSKRDRQRTYNVTLSLLHEIAFAMEKQYVLHIYVCVCARGGGGDFVFGRACGIAGGCGCGCV